MYLLNVMPFRRLNTEPSSQHQKNKANAQAAANEQLAKEQQRQGTTKTRSELLKRASELHDQRFALRKQMAEHLSNQFPSIRVTVTQAADLHHY